MLFADDTKFYNKNHLYKRFIGTSSRPRQLNQWSIKNRISLNIDKYFIFSYFKKYNLFLINNTILARKTIIKDLGVNLIQNYLLITMLISFEINLLRNQDY